ncbi:unnamed protein product [Arabidopsis halleri]
MMLKIFCYNIKDLNNPQRQLELKNWIQSNKSNIGGFLETHVQHENAATILARNFPGWRSDFNYSPQAENERIWIIWDLSISIFIYKKTDQLISCGVFDPATNHSFSVTFIYARNCMIARRELWSSLAELHQNSLQRRHPWLLLGAFNQILVAKDHYSLHPYTLPIQGIAELQSSTDTCELLELPSCGAVHTCAIVEALGGSDHSPLMVTAGDHEERRKVPFKFYSFFATHPDYPNVVETAWNLPSIQGSIMFSLCQKLMAVKLACKVLNRNSFSNIQSRAAEAHEILLRVQSNLLTNPSHDIFDDEKEARNKWSFLAVKAHLSRNRINSLRNEDDDRIYDKDQLKQLVVDYYQQILGSKNMVVHSLSVDQIRDLNSFRCTADMTSKVSVIPTPEEVTATIFSLPQNKAPGLDGFTADFFISSWHIVGPCLIDAVIEFFKTGKLLRQVNANILA